MESFLDRSQVADYLDITAEALTARIQGGNFPQPDVIVGEDHQGWARATVDRWQAPAVQQIYCKPTEVAHILTRIRAVAEDIRGHGRMPDSPGISILVPRELYALTGLIESELRRLVTTDHWLSRMGGAEVGEVDVGHIDFDLPPAPSLVVHPHLNLAFGAPNLQRAASELEVLAKELAAALRTGPAREFPDRLAAHATVVRAYVHTLAGPAGESAT